MSEKENLYLPLFANGYDLKMVRKLFHTLNLTGAMVLGQENGTRLVMFRNSGLEEDYTIFMEHDGWIKADEKIFQWSDKYDNYRIYLVNYEDAEKFFDEGGRIEWDFPQSERPCSLCGDGGCPSCKPSWFI